MRSATSNVRISPTAALVLESLSERLGRPKSRILKEALHVLDGQTFAAEVKESYCQLRADDAAWQDYAAEVAVWDQLASEGLPPAW